MVWFISSKCSSPAESLSPNLFVILLILFPFCSICPIPFYLSCSCYALAGVRPLTRRFGNFCKIFFSRCNVSLQRIAWKCTQPSKAVWWISHDAMQWLKAEGAKINTGASQRHVTMRLWEQKKGLRHLSELSCNEGKLRFLACGKVWSTMHRPFMEKCNSVQCHFCESLASA